jgi:4-coumarate--CoA ligase (photoactive yellow protein activation family)
VTDCWDLHRIPEPGVEILTGMLHAVVRDVLGRGDPLATRDVSPEELAGLRWIDAGCDAERLRTVVGTFGDLLSLPLAVPDIGERPGDLVREALAAWSNGPRTITFRSSGTTGGPKACPHEDVLLRQELVGVCPLVHDASAVLATAPAHHMFGFTFGLLLPVALGVPRRVRAPLPTVILADVAPGDILVAVPFVLNAIADSLLHAPRPGIGRGATVITATSPIPAATVRTLQDFGFRTIEIYGASETGCVGWRETPDVPYALLPHFRSMGDETLVRDVPGGGLREYPLPDHVARHGERGFVPLRRRDEAVQVAGGNVHPGRIAREIEGHEGVERCLVRLMRPEEGLRLKAFVVPRAGWSAPRLRGELRTFARERFSPRERPQSYTFGEELPKGPLGKPGDWDMSD